MGVVNTRTQQAELRLSRIVGFSDGAQKNWHEVLAVFSWLLAEPVGKTT